MRRYSRFRICKTNFHFFFVYSRLLKFNRPKWNNLKEKLKFIQKSNKNTFIFSKYSLSSLYHTSVIFKHFRYYNRFNFKKSLTFSISQSLVLQPKRDLDFYFYN
jgi:hypothetical protein